MRLRELILTGAFGLTACEVAYELFDTAPGGSAGDGPSQPGLAGQGGETVQDPRQVAGTGGLVAAVTPCAAGTIDAQPAQVTGGTIVSNMFDSVTLLDAASGAGLYGVTWSDTRDANLEIYLQLAAVEGFISMNDLRVTNDPSVSFAPSVAHGDGEFGIAWKDERYATSEIMFARFDTSTRELSPAVRVTESEAASEAPSLVWTGTEYLAAWYEMIDSHLQIFTVTLDSNGQLASTPQQRTFSSGDALVPELARSSAGFGLLWRDSRNGGVDIFFRGFDRTFTPATEALALTSDPLTDIEPHLSSTGSTYGAVWKSSDGSHFACIDTAGNAGPTVDLAQSNLDYNGVDVAALDDEFLVVLRDTTGALFYRFDAQGRTKEGPTRIYSGLVDAVAASSAEAEFGVFVVTSDSLLSYRVRP